MAAGKPGNRGGGRPKESLRQRMRELLDDTLEAMSRGLAGERLAHDARAKVMTDPRMEALDDEALAIVREVCRDHLTAVLSAREIGIYHETLARYGVGTQQQVESTEKQVRYVIRIPVKPGAAKRPYGPPVAVIDAASQKIDEERVR